jgi:hypothetical protein
MKKKKKSRVHIAIPPARIKAAAKIIGCSQKTLQKIMDRR